MAVLLRMRDVWIGRIFSHGQTIVITMQLALGQVSDIDKLSGASFVLSRAFLHIWKHWEWLYRLFYDCLRYCGKHTSMHLAFNGDPAYFAGGPWFVVGVIETT
eukprot:6192413-Pleurochrysis_carterae.AAC.4